MPAITESQVREKLALVKYPGFSRDIISFGLVKGIRIAGGTVSVQLTLSTNDSRVPQQIKEEAEGAILQIPGVEEAKVLIDIHAAPAQQNPGAEPARLRESRESATSSPSRAEREALGSRPSRRISQSLSRNPELQSVSATATFTGRVSR